MVMLCGINNSVIENRVVFVMPAPSSYLYRRVAISQFIRFFVQFLYYALVSGDPPWEKGAAVGGASIYIYIYMYV